MTPTMNQITTSDADLIAYHAKKTGQIPTLYRGTLSGRIIADVTVESREAFQNDIPLQNFLEAKKAVWRSISQLRGGTTR